MDAVDEFVDAIEARTPPTQHTAAGEDVDDLAEAVDFVRETVRRAGATPPIAIMVVNA